MHRLSLFWPAGLADGLALKELRYERYSIRPWPGGQLVPPRPTAEWDFGLDRRGHASSTANVSDGKSAASSAGFREGRGAGY